MGLHVVRTLSAFYGVSNCGKQVYAVKRLNEVIDINNKLDSFLPSSTSYLSPNRRKLAFGPVSYSSSDVKGS